MSSNAERLAAVVLARREQLDMNQMELWAAGGPSNTTLTTIENGQTRNLTRTTARKLDAGLRWEPGSARTVWEGGEPTPLAEKPIPDDVLAELGTLSESTQAYILKRLASEAKTASSRREEETA